MDPFIVGQLLGLALLIYLVVRVYSDAKERGLPAVGWAVAVFLFGLIAVVVYFIFARKYPPLREVQGGYHSGVGSTYGAGTQYRGGSSMPYGAPGAVSESADPDFADDELERLLQEGSLREARQYMNDMIQVAREMGDQKGVANYRKYERKLAQAARSGSRMGHY